MQLLVSGLTGDRFVITCNGRPLPLQPTGRNGEYVAGVRYRAWQPPSALHPTIPVHTPLTFDIVDTWMERSVAGCQYHVMHPGGRNSDISPVNSYEAESRRLARFTRLARTPGPVRAARSRTEPGISLHIGPANGAVTGLPLSRDYVVPDGHFDEVRAVDGSLREPWAKFTDAIELREEYLSEAQKRVARQIDENGVTYNVYATADGWQRPWSLDVLPLIVEAQEWERLGSGLRQRARLLNAVVTDLYGPQTLLREGLLPPALVFRHPGFLRACSGVRPADGVFLHLIAFDLARGADGEWRVVGTRTQAPSGVGYALENRAIMSRVLPDAFHALRVRALSSFFHELRQLLFAGAPIDGGAPHVVVLTPGPYNETYFEHAYLARQLGFPLVEGGDLTVRDERVFLKTVSGLRPVHAILRRLDDDFCDPLEMRPDSTLGVPGLVQAWRAGNVLVANAFGMSVLESPALLAFLPPLCERLFGETLEMPAIATWWCGETARSTTPAAVLRKGLSSRRSQTRRWSRCLCPSSTPTRAANGRSVLARHRTEYVVEEFLPLSHAPAWHNERLESRALMLRAFLLADGRGDYRVMPGGLSRIAGDDRHVVSGQRGGSSKDTWVLDLPVAPIAPVHRRARPREAHGEPSTSSRAAEHLFWLGRSAERSENERGLSARCWGRVEGATDGRNRLIATYPSVVSPSLPFARQNLLRAAASPNGYRRHAILAQT